MEKIIFLLLCICYFLSLAFQFLNDDFDHWSDPFIQAFCRPLELIGYQRALYLLLVVALIALAVPIEFL
ncbi:hypothetical protein hmeg3_19435 [Herbaspirillum sp. meg3]|nr:hypothetical protein hmeg3_19435 [Herbaspirillum sp. meg3]